MVPGGGPVLARRIDDKRALGGSQRGEGVQGGEGGMGGGGGGHHAV